MALVVPNAASLGHRLYKDSWLHLDPPRHIFLFTSSSLAAILAKTPFQVEKIYSSVRDAVTVFHASLDIRSQGFHVWGRPNVFLRHLLTNSLMAVESILPDRGEELVAVLRKN